MKDQCGSGMCFCLIGNLIGGELRHNPCFCSLQHRWFVQCQLVCW